MSKIVENRFLCRTNRVVSLNENTLTEPSFQTSTFTRNSVEILSKTIKGWKSTSISINVI